MANQEELLGQISETAQAVSEKAEVASGKFRTISASLWYKFCVPDLDDRPIPYSPALLPPCV